MDGNGRWAKKRLLPRIAGHKKGLNSIQVIIKSAINYNIPTATLYAFSTENWNRPSEEINGLMNLFSDSVTKRMESDVDVANFLSGGIDSTSIIKMLSEKNHPVNSFSVSYEDDR